MGARFNSRGTWLHLLRLSVFCGALFLIHRQHRQFLAEAHVDLDLARHLPTIEKSLPAANRIGPSPQTDSVGCDAVFDVDGRLIGLVARTSPKSDHILGFSGPTDLLLIFDSQQRLLATHVLGSRDTRDHVQTVIEAEAFWNALRGQSIEQLQTAQRVDTVSGATLTSLAILESIRFRLVAQQDSTADHRQSLASLRFPAPPRLEDVRLLYPPAQSINLSENSLWKVHDAQQRLLGFVLRTSPAADNLIGYQGPSDSLIALDDLGIVSGIALGISYDNEPYVDYVREDRYFRKFFNGQSIEQLAAIDFESAGIEGVSGATMTSINVAAGVIAAAAEHVDALKRSADSTEREDEAPSVIWHWLTLRNMSTLAIALPGALIGLTSLKRKRRLRLVFQLVLIGWLGLINGDMLSQALLLGWAQNGVPWRHAFGLTCLTATALLIPIATGHNVYCAHICPHGAVQQLIRNRLPWRLKLPRRAQRLLKLIPILLVGWVLAIGLLHLPYSPVDIEPFDAWVFSIAGTATLCVAAAGLVASAFVPMAYCRFGCPTGAVLDYLRFSGRSWSRRDTAGILLLALGIALSS